MECLTATEFTFRLENDVSLINALVNLIQGIVNGVGLCDRAGRLRVGMALEQRFAMLSIGETWRLRRTILARFANS